jgi:hypothetical protein
VLKEARFEALRSAAVDTPFETLALAAVEMRGMPLATDPGRRAQTESTPAVFAREAR